MLKTLCRPECIARLELGFVDHETSNLLICRPFALQSLVIRGIHLDCSTVIALITRFTIVPNIEEFIWS